MKKNQKKMISFTDHLDKYYGKRGEKKGRNMNKDLKHSNLVS